MTRPVRPSDSRRLPAPGDAAPGAGEGASVVVRRLHDPLALFLPDRRIVTNVPVALHLIEFLPASLKSTYARTPQGTIALEEDRLVRQVFRVNHRELRVEAHFDQVRGRVNTYDWDIMFGLWRLWDEGRVGPDGVLHDATYRSILGAAGRAATDDDIRAVKRALSRFAGAHLITNARVDYAAEAAAVAAGAQPPVLPEAWPVAIEKEGAHWVLEYDFEREHHVHGTRDRIEHLRLNPLWLSQAVAGKTAWLNIELHNRLKNALAKRLVALGTVRAAKNAWRLGEPWVTSARELEQLLGVAPGQPLNRVHTPLVQAFTVLREAGALHAEVRKAGRRDWEYALHMGDEFLIVNVYRGIQPYDEAETRGLLWHLRSFRVADAEARTLLAGHRSAVLETLRRAYFLLLVHGGREKPDPKAPLVQDWGAWIRACARKNASWNEPAYERWKADVVHGRVRVGAFPLTTIAPGVDPHSLPPVLTVPPPLPRARDAGPTNAGGGAGEAGGDPAAAALPSAAPVFAADVWGRALEALYAEDPRGVMTWLASTRLASVDAGAVVITVPYDFFATWIATHYAAGLEGRLAAALGHPVALRYEVASDASASRRDADSHG